MATESEERLERKRDQLRRYIEVGPAQSSAMGINHLAVLARDLEATADFYSNVLGMPVVSVTPNRDERDSTHMIVDVGNGVGLDTPQSAVLLLQTLARAGYSVEGVPADGGSLVERLRRGPTNAAVKGRDSCETLSLAAYRQFFDSLPETVRASVSDRWGTPQADAFFLAGESAFAIPAFRCANLVVGLQPARGYNIDPKSSYHDPSLVPPHGYLAFYAWLRHEVVFESSVLIA